MSWQADLIKYIDTAKSNLLTADSPCADQPAHITKTLRPHQLTLLEGARRLEKVSDINLNELSSRPILSSTYGVIGDRVGAGKSLVVLSMVKDPPPNVLSIKKRGDNGAHLLSIERLPPVQDFPAEWSDLSGEVLAEKMFGRSHRNRFYLRTALLIVPHHISQQWETYVKEQTTLKSVVIRKTTDCDYDRAGFYQNIFQSDVVIVSSTMFRKFVGALSFHNISFDRYVWSRLFIDEADTIQLPSVSASTVSSRFTWFITGSWLNILFESGMSSYYARAMPACARAFLGEGEIAGVRTAQGGIVRSTLYSGRQPEFTRLIVRNDDGWVDASLRRPEIIHNTILCRTPQNIALLKGLVSEKALEALHAGNTTGAISALGLQSISQDSLVARFAEDLKQDLEKAERVLQLKRELGFSCSQTEGKIERIKTQIATLNERIADTVKDSCPICFEPPATLTLTPCCRKAFCLACICECISKKASCPMCRTQITSAKDLILMGDGGEVNQEREERSPLLAKGEALLKLITESRPDQRFLVFSAHEASFRGLREMLLALGIRCELLYGAASRIEKLRKEFAAGKIRVLCLNARHVGAGVNLEAATDIVLFHKMNTELEKQVIGRAVRFERTAELRITHLVHENETAVDGARHSEVIVHV